MAYFGEDDFSTTHVTEIESLPFRRYLMHRAPSELESQDIIVCLVESDLESLSEPIFVVFKSTVRSILIEIDKYEGNIDHKKKIIKDIDTLSVVLRFSNGQGIVIQRIIKYLTDLLYLRHNVVKEDYVQSQMITSAYNQIKKLVEDSIHLHTKCLLDTDLDLVYDFVLKSAPAHIFNDAKKVVELYDLVEGYRKEYPNLAIHFEAYLFKWIAFLKQTILDYIRTFSPIAPTIQNKFDESYKILRRIEENLLTNANITEF